MRTAAFGVPIGRAQAGEGGNQIDLLSPVGLSASGWLSAAAMIFSPSRSHCTTAPGDEDRAFQRIGRLAVELVGDGGQQAVLRAHR